MASGEPLLMLAGPVKIDPRVIRAMATPSLGHRTPHFRGLSTEIRDLLRYAFGTEGPVGLLSGSGTAGLEALLAGILRAEDRVLCPTNGKFGERVCEITARYARVERLDFPWGRPVHVEAVREALEERAYDVLALCHNETSTGLTNPGEELGRLAREAGLLYLVDGITSVAGLPVAMEAWGIDGLVLGSQKCLAAPAGLSAVALSARGYARLREDRAYYLNLKAHVDRLEAGSTPYTPAIHLFLAFREALRLLREEGLEARLTRTARLGAASRAAGDALGLPLFPDRAYASNTVSAFAYPEGVDDSLRARLGEDHRVLVAGGQGPLKGRIFRIGHMGVCSFSDLLATFRALEAVLGDLGHPIEAGAGVAAVEAAREDAG
ncbi:MAG: pyridoxal-phosphate-dependent aminotransferase family protein [Thermoplasmata archaeon]